MPLKKYADSDFFLALLKNSDWLKEKARKIYEKNKGNIYVTPFTIAELMIVCVREKIHMRETLFQISRIANLEFSNWELFFRGAKYVEEGASVFDALLMASTGENEIISSDKIYEKFGFRVIDLKG
ncbi:MAG: PIN domain-containing protein [Nanoarchaeota archaeon]|nr:PIN domain-containing protein [Nanoarchaeota archaeon]MBU1501379.1 PIN domain-containing protein [Nanoarchaeota archaeon]